MGSRSRFEWRPQSFVYESPPQVDKMPVFDPRTGDHAWIMVVAFSVEPTTWREGNRPMLDQENLASVQGPCCFHCETIYSPELAKRRCKGKP